MNLVEQNPTSSDEAVLRLIGKLERCEGGLVIGWAAPSDFESERLTVELLIDGVPVSRTLADKHRPDVEAAGIGDGRYGFALPVPVACFDAAAHRIEVREFSHGQLLEGGPIEFGRDAPALSSADISAQAAPATRKIPIRGHLDFCRPHGIEGWVACVDRTHLPLDVELVIDGTVTLRVTADLHRPDLAAAGIGSGHHAFLIVPPDSLFDNERHTIEVREISSGDALSGSPTTARFNACQLWDQSASDDTRRRRKLADRALAFCQSVANAELDDDLHQILLRLHAWLQSLSYVRQARSAQALLNRVTSLRCRLEMDGFRSAREIGGSITDDWATDEQPITLELLEDETVVACVECPPGGGAFAVSRFTFDLPHHLLDDAVHRFGIRVKTFGGILGPWSFLVPSSHAVSDDGAAPAYDPVWRTVPAALAARKQKKPRAAPTKVDMARWALDDVHEAELSGDTANVLQPTLALGDALLEADQWAAACSQFESAYALDPTCAAALAGQVRCRLAGGDDLDAEVRLSAALRAFPDDRALHRLNDELQGRRRVKGVRTLAFYLPQYHPTPENDAWWGKGFTEWTNVGGATPMFDGHLQPRRPTSLGYYDLRLPEAANAQFDLARRYGVDGFCYYYYWFEGRRILERPLEDLASGRTGPFPFCICWANEDWTRSWDGTSGDVLLAQNHTPESDFAFIQDLAPLLRHADYIRVDNRPMVLIYRADKLATPLETTQRWRDWCRAEGIGELYLCAVQSFGFHDPRPLGFDAAVEFPPHCAWDRHPDLQFLQRLNDLPGTVPGFSGTVYDYQAFANAAMRMPREPYALHRTAMVAWDNTARRQRSGVVYQGFSIETFQRWVLANARRAAVEQSDGVCFINAWNEWAEGSVMEPDTHFGYQVLESARAAKNLATFDAAATFWLTGQPIFPEDRLEQRQRVLLIGHDAFPAGAQTNLLNMARCLKRQLDTDVTLFLIEGGELLPEYEKVATTHLIGKGEQWHVRFQEHLRYYARLGARKAICNTVLTADLMESLKQEGYRIAGLLHELPTLIEAYGLQVQCWRFADKADAIVCASKVVADEFFTRYWPAPNKLLIAAQGIAFNRYRSQRDTLRAAVREELGLPPACRVIVGCGYGDTRKGIDLFVQLAGEVVRASAPASVAFVWIGALDAQLAPYLNADVDRLKLTDAFRVTGRTSDPARYFIAGDVFALTSREDPFPSVVMEAFDAGMPVVAFNGGGGYVDIVNADTGALVPYLDVAAMSQAVLSYTGDATRRLQVGESNHTLCRERFGYAAYMQKLLALLAGVPAGQVAAGRLQRSAWSGTQPRPTITAIVPNFNYARYLELRLRTVIAQTLPPNEIIVLDDASTDKSLDIIHAMIEISPIPIRVITSKANSGNPFVQWAKGLKQARSELIWIAEADDYCEPTLLETLAHELIDSKVVMAWSDSVMVDDAGRSSGALYKHYYERSYGAKWRTHFRMSGRDLIDDCLLTENVLPNASAVLFRRRAAAFDLSAIKAYRFSGDWWFWLCLAQAGDVVYRAEPLNYHRRHAHSVMGDVLRAGESLLPETMGFFKRVATHMPALISPKAGLQVLDRLRSLFELFPALTAAAPRIAEHPTLAAPYAALMQTFAHEFAQHRPARPKASVLVLSHDVLAAQMNGAALVRHFCGVDPALQLVLVAPAAEARDFAQGLAMPDLSCVVIATDAATAGASEGTGTQPRLGRALSAEDQLRTLLRDVSNTKLVSHGLLAHCLLAAVTTQPCDQWTLVAGQEFDALLGQPPKAPGVTMAGVRAALAHCGVTQFVGMLPPHAFARMSQTRALPLDQLRLDATVPLRRAALRPEPAIRVLGIATQASADQWKTVAQALQAAANELGQTIRLRLLAWGETISELHPLETSEPNAELVRIFDRPAALQLHGDLMLIMTSDRRSDGSHLMLELERTSMPTLALESVVDERNGTAASACAKFIQGLVEGKAAQLGSTGITTRQFTA